MSYRNSHATTALIASCAVIASCLIANTSAHASTSSDESFMRDTWNEYGVPVETQNRLL